MITQSNSDLGPRSLRADAPNYLILTALLLTVVVFLNGCSQESLPPGEAEFSEGLKLLYAGDVEPAEEKFSQASVADPAHPWRELGKSRQIETYSSDLGAMKDYLRVAGIASDFDSAYSGYCRLALKHKKLILAENGLARFAQTHGLSQATERVSASDQESFIPSVRLYHLLAAQIEIERAEFLVAERRLKDLLEISPDDSEVRLTLARALLMRNEVDLALEQAKRALEEEESNRATLSVAIRFYIDAHYTDLATKYIDRLLDLYPNDLAAERFVFESYLALGYFDFADTKISRLEASGIPLNTVFYMKAQLAEAIGESRQAHLLYLEALTNEQSNMEIYRDIARTGTQTGNFMSADDDIKTAMLYLPKVPGADAYKAEAHMEIAESYLLNKQYGLFLLEINEAELFFSGSPRFEFQRIYALIKGRRADSANYHLSIITSSESSETLPWLLGIYQAFVTLNQLDSARVYLEKTLSIAPRNFNALLAKVELQQMMGDTSGSRLALETLVGIHNRNQQALRLQAAYHEAQGNLIEARKIADRLIELYPGSLSAYKFASSFALKLGGREAEQSYMRMAREANPNLPGAYYISAVSFLEIGLVDSSQANVDKAIGIDPNYEPALLTRGLLMENRGQADSAIALYETARDRNPYSAEALNRLAWVLISSGIRLGEATNYGREAISLSSGANGDIYSTLGWGYFKQKRYKLADIAFQSALNRDPNDPFKRYLWGLNFESRGMVEEAREQLQIAIDLGISGTYRELVDETLARLDG